jgi:hypothetical protein
MILQTFILKPYHSQKQSNCFDYNLIKYLIIFLKYDGFESRY